jgi:tetratricopeptide (TPR) repeat protein
MAPGERIAGRFVVERHAGAGGMGSVYLARDEQNEGRPVALKVLVDSATTALDVDRFDREAQMLSQLRHPGVVAYVGHGVEASGRPWLAMEWVEGPSLQEHLAEPMLREDAIALVSAIAAALGAAHARGIVHRDVKPNNIVLAGGDVRKPRLLDFGIARLESGENALTQAGAVIGTPGYMAPEQARGLASIDARADVYALGCLLFRALAGRTPFVGSQPVAVLARTIVEDAPHLRSLVPGTPWSLDALVAKLLARDPAERPADGAAVVRALATLGPDEADEATEAAPPSIASGEALTTSEKRFVTVLLGSRVGQRANVAVARELASMHHARFEALADGSFLMVLTSASSPTDLAVRACQAAMAMRDRDPSLALAIVAGLAVADGFNGEVFDRAAEAVRAAGAGAIAVDDATRALVSDRFEVAREGDLDLLRRPGGTERKLRGHPTPFVGRDREIGFLQGLYAECVEEGAARVVLVLAPPGAGKSRVRRELVTRLAQGESPPLVLLGVGDPLGASTPLGMVGAALQRAAGCYDADTRDVRTQLETWLGKRLGGDHAAIALLLDLAGVHDGDATILHYGQTPTVRAFLDWLGAELAERPVLIVLEDLHWGDAATIDLVDAALRAFAKKPLMVLALARPEVKTLFPQLFAEREPHELRLGPLGKAASAALVRATLETKDEATIARVVERAGGNAFFLEELIRAVGEGTSALPDTVLAVIQARLDALGSELTRVLRAASVFGETFWKPGVAALLGVDAGSRRLAVWLAALSERELIERAPETSIPGAAQLVFRHSLVREAAYAKLTGDDLALGHRLAGEWLEGSGAAEAAVLVEHYERAHENTRAIRWACVDAERALDAYDPSAYRRADRGIKLGASGEALGRLLLTQAQALDRRSAREALEAAERALSLFLPASVEWYRALFIVLSRIGEDAVMNADRFDAEAMRLASTTPRAGDLRAEVAFIVAVGSTIVVAGRVEAPSRIPQLVMALGPYFGRIDELPPVAQAMLYDVRSMGAALAKNPELALIDARRALVARKQAGVIDLGTDIAVAQRLAFLGQIEEATEMIEQFGREAVRLGLVLPQAVTRFAMTMSAYASGDYARAEALGRELRPALANFREGSLVTHVDMLAARCAIRANRLDEAEDIVTLVESRVSSSSPLRARVEMLRARLLLARGRAAEAVEVMEHVVATIVPSPFEQDDAEVALLRAKALVASGAEAKARAVAAEGVKALEAVASNISEPRLRTSFLENVIEHRELISFAAELRRTSPSS